MNIETVNELIASLESAGELSIREQKFLKLAKAFKQLAAENVALKEEISNITFMRDDDFFGSTRRAQEVMGRLVNVKTTATDRIVAGIKADGVEEFAAKLRIPGDDQFFDALAKGVALAADDFAKQLREGEDK
ncbi:hypothetical protein L1C97_05470 [Klebsiella pneumoniae]|uniref:hypothetical protein n=1 Tax=Klebsiella pneumoniae TaxID=573 RepID=UPI0020CEAECF|nr:hypothetical protein [Klebsiella pneumoniae]MCQ0741414.1 hypothetical protein [Klebsiella pneumoniae]